MIRLLSRLAAALLVLAQVPASAATYPATPATFPAIQAAAVAGDVVQLAPGSYGALVIQGKGGLTIEGTPEAVFRTFSVVGSSDIALKGFGIDWTPRDGDGAKTNVGRIYNSKRVGVLGLKMIGRPVPEGTLNARRASEDPPPPENSFLVGYPAGRGLAIEFSEDVTVEGVELSGFFTAISTAAAKNVRIVGNYSHHNRATDLKGGAEGGLEILNNRLGPSNPYRYNNNLDGDHLEPIHIYTGSGRPPLAGLVIRGNLLNTIGGYPSIGIAVADAGGVTIPNAVIAENVVITSNAQALSLTGGVSATVTGNNFLAPPGTSKWPTMIPRTAVIHAFTGNTLYDQSTRPFLREIYPDNVYRPKVAIPLDEIAAVEAAWLAKYGGPATNPAPPAPPTPEPQPQPTPAPAPPEPDPRDAQIAALEAQVATLSGRLEALTAQLATASAELAALNARVERLLAERAQAAELANLARRARAKNQYLDPLVALYAAPAP